MNLIAVYDGLKQKSKLPSIRDLTPEEEIQIIRRLLKGCLTVRDAGISAQGLIQKYRDEIITLCTIDKDTQDAFGYVNTWWVFGEVASKLDYSVFMAEADNIGYKRYKKNKTTVAEKPMPNELFRVGPDSKVVIDDGITSSILDYIRTVNWE